LVHQRKVPLEKAAALAKQLNISYMETSALNASNVEEAFTTLVTNIYHKKKHGPTKTIPVPDDPTDEISPNPKPFPLRDHDESSITKRSGCCTSS
jgi:Ras family